MRLTPRSSLNVRNPMYIGVLLVIIGWAVYWQSWQTLGYAAMVGTGFHCFVVLVEEPVLEGKFGEPYLKYCGDVRRWLPKMWRQRAT